VAFGYKVYFTERPKNRVICWDPDTDKSEVVAGEPEDEDESQTLISPYGLAMDKDGTLLVADKHHNRICRLKNGRLEGIETHDKDGRRAQLKGNRANYPRSPAGIFYKSDGSILCSFSDDTSIYTIQPDGGLELLIGHVPPPPCVFRGFLHSVPVDKVQSTPIRTPTQVLSKEDGTVYFIERGYEAVKEYHPDRGIRSLFDASNFGSYNHRRPAPDEVRIKDHYSSHPTGLALDHDENLYLADGAQRCVWRIDFDADILTCVMRTTEGISLGAGPSSITFGKDGTLWVLDTAEGGVLGFQQNGSDTWKKLDVSIKTEPDYDICPTAEGAGIVCGQ